MKNNTVVIGIMLILMLAASALPAFGAGLSDQANIRATLLSQSPDPVAPGRYVEVRFQIENLGTYPAENLVFELVPEYPFSLDPGDSVSRILGTINARSMGDEAAIVYYKLRVDPKAVEGDNTLKLRYSVDDGDSWAYFDDFTIRVQGDASQVGIASVQAEPDRFVPGQETDLTIKVSNMGESFIQDIAVKLDLSSSTLPFAPVNSATEKKVKTIQAGSSADFSFSLITTGNAESDIYKVPVQITYSDSTGTSHTKSDYISLVVGTAPDLVVLLDSQTFYTSGSKGDITVKIVNKGVTNAKFMTLELGQSDSFELLSPGTVYLGKIDSDDFETADFTIYAKPTSEKYLSIPLRIEYTDANNKAYTQDITLQARLYSASELKKYGFSSGNPLVGIIIVLAIVGGGYYLYRRRKKARK